MSHHTHLYTNVLFYDKDLTVEKLSVMYQGCQDTNYAQAVVLDPAPTADFSAPKS